MQSGCSTGCGRSRPEKNISETERMLSVSGGSLLAAWGARNLLSLNGAAAVIVGGALLYRGMTGHCSLYKALQLDSSDPPDAKDSSHSRGQAAFDAVEEGSEESFPASDAPSWTGSSASRARG